MNDFLNTITSVAKKAANAAATEISIAGEETKVRTAYQEIGKIYYQSLKSGSIVNGDDVQAQVAKIDAALSQIESLKRSKNVLPDEY